MTEFLILSMSCPNIVRKEMNGSGATEIEILHELVHETTRKSENHELIRVVYSIMN